MDTFNAFKELEQPYWKFWRWGKRKKAEFVLDEELCSFQKYETEVTEGDEKLAGVLSHIARLADEARTSVEALYGDPSD